MMEKSTAEKGMKSVIALGMFDGMHIGHCALLRQAVALAQANHVCSIAYTFENHPLSVFGVAPRLLSTSQERRQIMRGLGIDRVEMPEFDQKLADLAPEKFASILVEHYGAVAVVAGFNYTFGKGGKGTVDTLETLGSKMGYTVHVVKPVLYHGAPVSSSRIRQALAQGAVDCAADMLGRPYILAGQVNANRQIGTQIGFPTANLEPQANRMLPKSGVYATIAQTPMGRFPAVTNVGNNPTVHGKKMTIETHLLDFTGDLYGAVLQVEFHRYIREEHTFPSKAALAAQIGRDVAFAKGIFEQNQQERKAAPYRA